MTARRQLIKFLMKRIGMHMIEIVKACDQAERIKNERMKRLKEPLKLTDDVKEEDLPESANADKPDLRLIHKRKGAKEDVEDSDNEEGTG
jgi:hypothetical protein